MTVQVPAAALALDDFAPSCEFFSIGSNDLLQYTMAIDRSNSELEYLSDPMNTGFQRLLQNIVDQSVWLGRPVSLCGELAGDGRFLRNLVEPQPLVPSVVRSHTTNSSRAF